MSENWQRTNEFPVFTYHCIACKGTFRSNERTPYANLNGKAFEDYHCEVCHNNGGAPSAKASVERDGSGDYNVIFAGRVVVSRESFTVADRICEEINSGAPDIATEVGDVAAQILRAQAERLDRP